MINVLKEVKQYLKEYVQSASNPFDLPADRVKTIRFYPSMPQSSIIHNAHTLTMGDIQKLRSVSTVSSVEVVIGDTSPDTGDTSSPDTTDTADGSPASPDSATETPLKTPTGDDAEWKHMTRIASALYEKYIRRFCELEINISWTLRGRWDVLHCQGYPEEDIIKLIQIVDEVLSEMLRFIQQSFQRFELSRK